MGRKSVTLQGGLKLGIMEKEYWEQRWKAAETGWDLGGVSPALKDYVDQLKDRSIRILIPGCGNAYEAEYLWTNGFENTFIVEISALAIESFVTRCPDFPKDQIFHLDFFQLTGQFDLILEQTFFCAIHPEMRSAYAKKMAELLAHKGKLVGLLFDFPLETGPPFGGSKLEYEGYFTPYFNLRTFETATNSIKPRLGREFFMILEKR